MRIIVEPRRAGAAVFILAWLAMLVLAALSFGLAFIKIGFLSPVFQFLIAFLQASVLFILFMRLKGSPSLKWVFAAAGFVWLLFLFGLSMTDYADRRGWPSLYVPYHPDRAIRAAD
jgi:caa(3)-type oxidase subunit IV